jgi:hypothetical protein
MNKSACFKIAFHIFSVRVTKSLHKEKVGLCTSRKKIVSIRTESPTVNELFDLPIRAELATATP